MICKKLLKKKRFINFILFAVCDAFESDYMFCAAAIAYFTLVSIIPLFITFFFIEIIVFNVNVLSLVPKELLNSPLKPLFERIQHIITTTGILSGTAIPIMLWFARGVFLAVERSFTYILGKCNPAGYIGRNLLVILFIFVLWILMFAFYTLKLFFAVVFPLNFMANFLSSIGALSVMFLILFCLYYFLLPVKFHWKIVLKVSVFIFTMLTIFERLFLYFIENISKIDLLFGSFAAVIIFLLWIYYSAIMVLIGAGILKAKMIAEDEYEENQNC